MRSPIVPSGLAVVLLALLAPAAVVVAAIAPAGWLAAPIAGVALLVLTLLDGLLAPRLRDLKFVAPADIEVGQPAQVSVHVEFKGAVGRASPRAALGFDPRLGTRGAAEFSLSRGPVPDIWAGATGLVSNRRGTGMLHDLWLRWNGPLGLAHRQARRSLDQPVRIWPDLSPVRSPVLQAFMRDAQIVFAFDCGQAMCEPVDGLPRIDRAVSAALMASYVALKGGDRVALFGFADKPELMTPFATDTRAFHRLQTAAAGIDYVAREPNFTLALATLTARLKRRSLVVLFSDFADPTSAELMVESVERLVRHHLVIFVTMEDAELSDMAEAEPATLRNLATAVAADSLARQRALVLQRLRRLGVDVIEAPWQAIGYRLIDRYLAAKQAEAVG